MSTKTRKTHCRILILLISLTSIGLVFYCLIFSVKINTNKIAFSNNGNAAEDIVIAPLAQHQIPRIVHLVYINADNDSMVEVYRADIQSCMDNNPDLTFILWYDWNFNLFMQKHIPEERRKLMQDSSVIAGKSDIARYFLLYHFGGIYLDIDTQCKRPMYDEHLLRQTCIFGMEPRIQTQILHGREYSLMNNFIACVPEHPFLGLLISNLEHSTTDIFSGSGPFYVTRFYELYQKMVQQNGSVANLTKEMKMWPSIVPTSEGLPPVSHVDSDLFHPNIDSDAIKIRCTQLLASEKCNQVMTYEETHELNDPQYANKVVMLHHWLHMGYEQREKLQAHPQFKPSQVFPRIKFWPPSKTVESEVN